MSAVAESTRTGTPPATPRTTPPWLAPVPGPVVHHSCPR